MLPQLLIPRRGSLWHLAPTSKSGSLLGMNPMTAMADELEKIAAGPNWRKHMIRQFAKKHNKAVRVRSILGIKKSPAAVSAPSSASHAATPKPAAAAAPAKPAAAPSKPAPAAAPQPKPAAAPTPVAASTPASTPKPKTPREPREKSMSLTKKVGIGAGLAAAGLGVRELIQRASPEYYGD